MKVDQITMKKNDDGTYQVKVCGGGWGPNQVEKSYSAKDLTEAIGKVTEGEKAITEHKSAKKEKMRNDSMDVFIGKEEDEDD